MSKKSKPKYGAAQAVQGEIVTMKTIDCSKWIKNPEEWTRGPVLPMTAMDPPARKKRREANGRKKQTRG
jgi:hypothetical protein